MANYNPIATAITSIVLVSDADAELNIDVFIKNQFCQFERIELEESVNNVFPVGALIVRDTSDILTYIAINKIKTITVTFADGESYKWYITSLNYPNNAASEIDQNFVTIYFTNSIYHQSQNVSFYDEKVIIKNPETGEEEESEPQPLWLISHPFVTTPEHIINTYGNRSVFEKPLFTVTDPDGKELSIKGCGVNLFIKNTQEPVNYVLFRPRISDPERLEQFQTNIVTYLNYIFTYAVNADENPYYLFWTDFSNCLNYKYFDLRKDLQSNQYSFELDNRNPGQIQAYAVYNSDDVDREFEIEGTQNVKCKKVYVLVTNPAHTIQDKNYYYMRSSPIYLEQASHELSGSTSNPERLMSPFLSESANTTLSTITSYTINDSSDLEYAFRVSNLKDKNLINLPDKGYWGYAKDFNTLNVNINVTDAVGSYENILNNIEATPLALRDSYFPNSEQTPLYPFNDNRYIWQFQYDVTRTHPNIIRGVSGDEIIVKEVDFYQTISDIIKSSQSSEEGSSDVTSDLIATELRKVTLNKVLQAKYNAMIEQNFYDNHRRLLLEQTEKENFVSNVLCCIGKEIVNKEDWFFAKITGFASDKRQILGSNNEPIVGSLQNAWIYSWKRLEPGPIIAGLSGSTASLVSIHASQHSLFHGWTLSTCAGSTGYPTSTQVDELLQGKGFTGLETWAINLNERLNCVANNNSLADYLGPGYNRVNLSNTNFRLKPIGFTGPVYNSSSKVGSAEQIVKMYRIPVNELRNMGALVPVGNFEGEYVYYFDKENAVDGAC